MPVINKESKRMGSLVVTEFVDSVGSNGVTYTLQDTTVQQETLAIYNISPVDLLVSVGVQSNVSVPAYRGIKLTESFTSFTIQSVSGVGGFRATCSYEDADETDEQDFMRKFTSQMADMAKQTPWVSVESSPIIVPEIDDTARINRAITAGAGGIVQFAGKTYSVSSQINVPAKTTLLGVGKDVTIVNATATITLFNLTGDYITIERMQLKGNSTAGSVGVGIVGDTKSVMWATIRDCRINLFHKGVYVYSSGSFGGWYANILNCAIKGYSKTAVGSIGVHFDGNANGNTVQGGTISVYETASIVEAIADSALYLGLNDVTGCGTGIWIKGTNNRVIGCRFELNGATGAKNHIKIDANYNSVIGCSFDGTKTDNLVVLGGSVTTVTVLHHDPTVLDLRLPFILDYDGSTGSAIWKSNTDFQVKDLSNINTLTANKLLSNNYVGLGKQTSLPSATSALRGYMTRVEGATGVADTVNIAVKRRDDTYDWINVPLSKTGTLSGNGDGATTTFNIPHGLGNTPSFFMAIAANTATGTAGIKYVTADATNIIVNFNTAPVTGTGNVFLKWKAEL